jgi:hypothetical protein
LYLNRTFHNHLIGWALTGDAGKAYISLRAAVLGNTRVRVRTGVLDGGDRMTRKKSLLGLLIIFLFVSACGGSSESEVETESHSGSEILEKSEVPPVTQGVQTTATKGTYCPNPNLNTYQ